MREVWHFHQVWFFVIALHLPTCNVWLESCSEIDCAHDRVDDCDDDQNNGDDSKYCERFAYSKVMLSSVGVLVHSHKLEDKIRQSAEVEGLHHVSLLHLIIIYFQSRKSYNDPNHAYCTLFSRNVTCQNQNKNCDGDCGDRQCKLGIFLSNNHDDKLDSEAEEEEKVEFKKGDIDLRALVRISQSYGWE